MSSFLLNVQLIDNFLGTGFLRIINRSLGGTLILDRPSERYHSILYRDVDEIGVDEGTQGNLPLDI
jgi:hypothetical protein